jgi:hypothetical protein
MEAVKSDKEIEDRCKAYCSWISERIDKLEFVVGQKASFAQVDVIQAQVNVANFNISKLAGDIVKINQKVMLLHD